MLEIVVVFDGLGSRLEKAAAEKKIVIYNNETRLSLKVDLGGVGIGGDLWPAATLFSNVLTSQAYSSFFTTLFADKEVLELGSGTGLCGILIDKVFAPKRTVVTDQDSHLALMRENLLLNQVSPACSVEALDWTNPATFPPAQSFDIILAMECVYREQLYTPLIASLLHCMRDDAICFLGLTRQFAKPHFFTKLTTAGLHYTLVPHEALPPSCSSATGGRDCGIFLLQKIRQNT